MPVRLSMCPPFGGSCHLPITSSPLLREYVDTVAREQQRHVAVQRLVPWRGAVPDPLAPVRAHPVAGQAAEKGRGGDAALQRRLIRSAGGGEAGPLPWHPPGGPPAAGDRP